MQGTFRPSRVENDWEEANYESGWLGGASREVMVPNCP